MAGIKGEVIYGDNGEIISVTGGRKAAQTNKEKYGEDFYRTIGSKGGKKMGLKGFALATPEFRRQCGRKGGMLSKRGKARVSAYLYE